MKVKVRGAILIISCHKHKETRLKKFMLAKREYEGYKVFYIIGNPNIYSSYELRHGNFITIKCEDSYLHILKKVVLAINIITSIYEIEEGILRCGDDLIFHESNLCKFLNSKKTQDYMGYLDGHEPGNEVIQFEDISRRKDSFISNYFDGHQEDLLNPLNGLEKYKDIIPGLIIVPNCRYINGVVTWLSMRCCNILINTVLDKEWDTFHYTDKYGYPYIIEDVGIGFILAKNGIYPVDRKYYTIDVSKSDETFAFHTNEFK